MVDPFASFITCGDIFTLALACTSITDFDSDNMKWHWAIFEICEKHKDSVPELRTIFFDHRYAPSLPPMCNEVYSLRSLLGVAREMQDMGPYFEVAHMSQKVKEKIKKREKERLAKYTEQIKDMAKIFEKHLKRV